MSHDDGKSIRPAALHEALGVLYARLHQQMSPAERHEMLEAIGILKGDPSFARPTTRAPVNLEGVTGDAMDQGAERAAMLTRLMAAASPSTERAKLDQNGGQRPDFSWVSIHNPDELEKFFRATIENIKPDAEQCGYAIGVHGSLRRDLDLIAAPWTEDHADKDELARVVQEAACGLWQEKYQWTQKPCGRWSTSIPICWLEYQDDRPSAGCIDLSVMPATSLPSSASPSVGDTKAVAWKLVKDNGESFLTDDEHIGKLWGRVGTVTPLFARSATEPK